MGCGAGESLEIGVKVNYRSIPYLNIREKKNGICNDWSLTSGGHMYQEDKVYIQFFENHKNDIPNIDRLIKILKSDQKPGHLVHAECVKRFFESNVFNCRK